MSCMLQKRVLAWQAKREQLRLCLSHMRQFQLAAAFHTWQDWLAEEVQRMPTI